MNKITNEKNVKLIYLLKMIFFTQVTENEIQKLKIHLKRSQNLKKFPN